MSADTQSTRWRVLALLAIAELFGMSLWFAASAVTPQLRAIRGLTASEAAWLTTIVQLGFVCGTAVAALLNLPSLPAFATIAVGGLGSAWGGIFVDKRGRERRWRLDPWRELRPSADWRRSRR